MTALIEWDESLTSGGLVFIAHGLGGWRDQPLIQSVARAFVEQGFRVVRYDATKSVGEADGKYEDATATSILEDLEDTLAWAAGQAWYREPFVLAGHSLGGMAAGLWAEHHPGQVSALCLVAPVVSGQLSFSSERYRDKLTQWREQGWLEVRDPRDPERRHRLAWQHVEDRLQYDLIPEAGKLTLPVLLIAGERDNGTPIEHQRVLLEALPGPKELRSIPGAGHTFESPEAALGALHDIVTQWIVKGREEAWERIKSRMTRSS
jgi:pimeloyl-ACP methyl ester carboxylesterase